MSREEKMVILASSLGTVFEWCGFDVHGALAATNGVQFVSSFPEATRNIFAPLAAQARSGVVVKVDPPACTFQSTRSALRS